MFPLSLFTWWYSAGWRDQAMLISSRLSRVSDYFSIGLLLRSLFSPFRQISAETVRGGLDVQVRAWLDRLISRGIGAMIRTVIIVIAILALVVECFVGFIRLLVWPFVPVLPLVGLVLAIIGLVPWRI